MLRHGYYDNFSTGMTRVANPTNEQAAEYYLLDCDPEQYKGEFIGELLNALKKEILRAEADFNPHRGIRYNPEMIYKGVFARMDVNKLWVEVRKNLILYNYDGDWLLYAKISDE
jgi:hypothetical protein